MLCAETPVGWLMRRMIERRWKHLVVANPMSMSLTTVVMRMVPPIPDDQLDMGPGGATGPSVWGDRWRDLVDEEWDDGLD